MTSILPVSLIVPTCNRHEPLGRMFDSLAAQSAQPIEAIVVDSSDSEITRHLCQEINHLQTEVKWFRATEKGAAAQRNQAILEATQPHVLFVDDDVVFESDCLQRLWEAINSHVQLGGVSSMIVNQRYSSPGFVSRTLFRILNGKPEITYAGKCIGPALNLLPEDDPGLGEVVPVEWINSTCSLYRREALPTPAFDAHFVGYSVLEDLTLSLNVGKKWKLANARTARIFHNSQPADYKNHGSLAEMELTNRHHVMVHILGKSSVSDYAKLTLLELFQVLTPLTHARAWKSLPAVVAGKLRAMNSLVTARQHSRVEAAVVEETKA